MARMVREMDLEIAKPRRASASGGSRIPVLVVVIVMGAFFCAVSLHIMSRTPLITTDSAAYLSAAHNLVSGKGLTTGFNPTTSVAHPAQVAAVYGRVPLAQYGPLYPSLLALFQFVGFSVDNSIRAVGILALVAFIGVIWALAMRTLEGRIPLVALMVLLCVVEPGAGGFPLKGNPWALSTFALSDLLFYVLVVAFFLATDTWLRTQSRMSLTVVVLVLVGAVLTRYAGVSLAAVAALAALGEVSTERRARLRNAMVMVGSGVGAFVGWDLVNKIAFGATSPRTVAFHPDGRLAQEMLHVAAAWFFPSSWPTGLTYSATAAIVVAVVVCSLFPPARDRLVGTSTRAMAVPDRLWRIAGLFVVGYVAMLVVTRTWLDAQLSIGQRILGPLQITLYVVIGSMIYWAVRTRLVAPRSQRWAVASVMAATALVWLPSSSSLLSPVTSVIPKHPSVASVPALAASKFVMTTDTARMYLSYGHDSILLPFYRFPTTDRVNGEFHQDLIDVGELVRQRHGVVVMWSAPQQSFPSADQLETVAHLMPVQQLPDGGVVYAPH